MKHIVIEEINVLEEVVREYEFDTAEEAKKFAWDMNEKMNDSPIWFFYLTR